MNENPKSRFIGFLNQVFAHGLRVRPVHIDVSMRDHANALAAYFQRALDEERSLEATWDGYIDLAKKLRVPVRELDYEIAWIGNEFVTRLPNCTFGDKEHVKAFELLRHLPVIDVAAHLIEEGKQRHRFDVARLRVRIADVIDVRDLQGGNGGDEP